MTPRRNQTSRKTRDSVETTNRCHRVISSVKSVQWSRLSPCPKMTDSTISPTSSGLSPSSKQSKRKTNTLARPTKWPTTTPALIWLTLVYLGTRMFTRTRRSVTWPTTTRIDQTTSHSDSVLLFLSRTLTTSTTTTSHPISPV